jgi:hypothetical protein
MQVRAAHLVQHSIVDRKIQGSNLVAIFHWAKITEMD